MILLIIKTYLTILLPISMGAICLFAFGMYWIIRKTSGATTSPHSIASKSPEFNSDLSAISGDDLIATQLDLARAYIETDKKQIAKSILAYVAQQGTDAQQAEAQQLMQQI